MFRIFLINFTPENEKGGEAPIGQYHHERIHHSRCVNCGKSSNREAPFDASSYIRNQRFFMRFKE